MSEKIRLGLVASGSGTDANAIMAAYRQGRITKAEPVILVSTKTGAGCIDKAMANGIDSVVIERQGVCLADFRFDLLMAIRTYGLDMLFLVGCVVVIQPFLGLPMYNIHPADPISHGGRGMYGLAVHEHVLAEIRDEIRRGWKKTNHRFFTCVTIHEVSEEVDQGEILCQARVEIPKIIVKQLVDDKIEISQLAAKLQEHVLPYEWELLPFAVEMAAKKIIDAKQLI